VTPVPASIARIVWNGLRQKPARVLRLYGASAALWITAIGILFGSTFIGRDRGLARLAFPLMNGAWFTGFMLFQFAVSISFFSGKQSGWVAQHGRGRRLRWLWSSEATFVDLSGTARQRAQRTADANASTEQPDVTVIAVPVLTALSAACFGFAGAMTLADAYVAPRTLLLGHPHVVSLFWAALLLLFLFVLLSGAGGMSMNVYGWATERAAAAARARADLERARLGALQAQMNPHFLFNTLNAVATLAGSDSPRAERVVEHLSAVLRHSLQRANRPFTSVDDEMRFIREYLDVEQERLGARLRVTWDVGGDTLQLRVPTASVQPLVENAVTYAIDPRPEGGHIHIASTRTAGGYLLRLSVEDNGPGFPADMKEGHGLGDLRQRLRAEYDRTCEVDTETLPTGARVSISVPATRIDSGPAGSSGEER
jgi:signal transduction histidine kinase